jgi:purine-binding chemotaxis protein CheW
MQTSDKYIELGVANENHALRITDINEIIKMQTITKLPNGSSETSVAKGVINLRGSVIPVLSLRAIFGLPEVDDTKSTRIVVVSSEGHMLGLAVDSVSRVVTFTDIQPPPHSVSDGELTLIDGVGRTEDRLVMIMNLGNVLKSIA